MIGCGSESSTSTSKDVVPVASDGSVTRSRTVCVPDVGKVTVGVAEVESPNDPSLSRSHE